MFAFADTGSAAVQELGVFAFGVGAVVVLYNLVMRRTWLNAALEWSPVRFVGIISYALYLWHYPIHGTVTSYIDRGSSLVSLALTFAFAVLSLYIVERPFLRLKSRLARRRPVDVTPAAVTG